MLFIAYHGLKILSIDNFKVPKRAEKLEWDL
jgi:hypothetical protein